ncbi:transmembrane protein, putative (macronuclear) [Tetrahymena thermophila SB210]|uniref:Transmembrane protein, putative n=1 Tax=Tetrahymena thermophila (strain SB210) TaxID=312017 RepID=Q236W9_TETTS|nr:transmembrane protein, putative [Tetrahymena thermophila SB210]EAR92381.2 transmembrane protein, putative [Tetrahymena thermophila SB210]|eukprot:XP_001012626.2 transmembrane protein, putative [Tetrahymena thermophila SB210]
MWSSHKFQRILETEGSRGSGIGGSINSHSNSRSSSSSLSSCFRSYIQSNVKIASWLCQDSDFYVEDYMYPQDCYVYFFSWNEAFVNGLLRSPTKDIYNFSLVEYQPNAYFPEIELVCLILFSYYNQTLSFNSIFLYTTNYILQQMKKLKKQMAALQLIPSRAIQQDNIQNEDNIHIKQTEIQNPKKVNEIPAQTISGVGYKLNLENEDNIIKFDFIDNSIQKSTF